MDGKDKLLKFKWMLSKASLLKKGSWYKQSYDLLKELEKEIDAHLETLQQTDSVARRKSQNFMYKTLRDLARICSILRDHK